MKVRALQDCFIDNGWRAAGTVFHTAHPLTEGVLVQAADSDVAVMVAPPKLDTTAGDALRERLARGALGGASIVVPRASGWAPEPGEAPASMPQPVSVQLPESVPLPADGSDPLS